MNSARLCVQSISAGGEKTQLCLTNPRVDGEILGLYSILAVARIDGAIHWTQQYSTVLYSVVAENDMAGTLALVTIGPLSPSYLIL